jgi:hypothetical protein
MDEMDSCRSVDRKQNKIEEELSRYQQIFASDLLVLLRKTKRSISPDGTRRSSIFDDLSNLSRKFAVRNPTNLIPR